MTFQSNTLPVKFTALCIALLFVNPLPAQTPSAKSPRRPVFITGEVVASDSQLLFVPPSNSSPVLLRNFVKEGESVKAGDLVLRIETPVANNIEQLQTNVDQTLSRLDSDVAKLEVSALEAEKNLILARAALAKAQVDAALPKSQISALDFDKYQTDKEKAERDLEVKLLVSQEARESVKRRRSDGDLDIKKQQIQLKFAKDELAQAEVHAIRDGVVVHGFNSWRNERIEEGSSVYPGNQAGQIIGSGGMMIKAWALEADRLQLRENMPVNLYFDAMPEVRIQSHIRYISGAPEAHDNWGKGRYFRVEVPIPDTLKKTPTPGMSVRIEPADQVSNGTGIHKEKKELSLEGEIHSHQMTSVLPPTIPYIWQYTIGQIAPEGSKLKEGDMIVQLQAAEVMTKLNAQKSTLNEKLRARDKMMLEHAEAEKSFELAVAEARANAEKAARKATMPKELIRRVDYDKLVIDKGLNAELAQIAIRLRDTQSQARKAERRTLELEIARTSNQIDVLQKGMQAMTVKAKRAGILIYNNSFNGDKITAGSQIWIGLSIASIADPEQLFVSAKVPEAQISHIQLGQPARITISGANQTLTAKVKKLGTVFHSKSNTQPSIVQDIELEFDQPPANLKPGSAVQVILPVSKPASNSAGKGGVQ